MAGHDAAARLAAVRRRWCFCSNTVSEPSGYIDADTDAGRLDATDFDLEVFAREPFRPLEAGGMFLSDGGCAAAAAAVILVGEGDFSFARCLAELHARRSGAPRIICSSLDSEETVVSRYGDKAAANLSRLEKLGATVLHEVDATELATEPQVLEALGAAGVTSTNDEAVSSRLVVIFQFPHHSGKGRIDKNRALLRGFLGSAARLLRERNGSSTGVGAGACGSEIRVTLAAGQGGTELDGGRQREWANSWQIVEQAQAEPGRLVMQGGWTFDSAIWAGLGYGSRGRKDRGLGLFNTSGAVTHVFVPEGTGVSGVCCPIWPHDVGFWCTLAADPLLRSNSPAVTCPFPPGLTEFVEAELDAFVRGFIGDDWLRAHPGHGRTVLLLVNQYARGDSGGDAAHWSGELKNPEYEALKQRCSHRLTYRLLYQATGCRALCKSRARDTQLRLREAIATRFPHILLT